MKKRVSKYGKMRKAVRLLHYHGFISEFERDSFLMRLRKSESHEKEYKKLDFSRLYMTHA